MKSIYLTLALAPIVLTAGCFGESEIKSASGVGLQSVQIETNPDGTSVEQRNIMERLKRDNNPGSIKFLYLVSPFTGEVILQSSVKGKVTSSSKRLTPEDLRRYNDNKVEVMSINGEEFTTDQLPGDDGTYGSSAPYLYWFDQNDVYHQTYTGAAIVHITDAPMTFNQTTQVIEGQ